MTPREQQQLIDGLLEIAQDCEQVANEESVHGGEKRAWLAVARKARAFARQSTDAEAGHSEVPETVAVDRAQIIEACAKICETNNLVSGSIGPLMDHGWAICQRACANAIRSLLAAQTGKEI